ncbi:TM2 [Beggiatoa sp. PS]|nr:TM2 [Beggiatoa sp. PS]
MTQPSFIPVTLLISDEKSCSTCDAVIHRKAEICPKCGIRQRKPADKLILLFLAFFLGGFGLHRFYLGNYFLGILYLLFSWTGISSFIAFIEGIVFLFTSRETIENNYTAHDSAVLFVLIMPFIILFIVILAAIILKVLS